MYEYYELLLEKTGFTTAEVCAACGLNPTTISNWKARRHTLGAKSLQKIATFFGVSVEFLLTGKDTEKTSLSGKQYYFSDDTALAAEKIFKSKQLRMAFDALADLPEDELTKYCNLLLAYKQMEDSDADR